MKLLGTLLVAGALLFTSFSVAAYAEEQDMAEITCKQFIADKENMPLMLMWMDGYLSGKSDNTVISNEWIQQFATHLGTYCTQNPDNTIMQAMEALPE